MPLPSIDRCIVEGDSLGEEIWTDLPNEFDVVLGNPPFIATGRVPSRDVLSRRFRAARGRFDFSYLFVELAISRLIEGGALGLVIPNRLFINRDASIIRGIITSEMTLNCLIDFGTTEVFEGASAYIGIITAEKWKVQPGRKGSMVRVVLVSDVSDTRYLGGAIADALGKAGEV